MATCDRCFDGRHIRCRGRRGCSCTYCAKEFKRVPFPVSEAKTAPLEEIMSAPIIELRPNIKWEGERDANGRTAEQQAHYNELQKRRRQEQRGDPDWLLDKDLLVTKIQAVFTRLENAS